MKVGREGTCRARCFALWVAAVSMVCALVACAPAAVEKSEASDSEGESRNFSIIDASKPIETVDDKYGEGSSREELDELAKSLGGSGWATSIGKNNINEEGLKSAGDDVEGMTGEEAEAQIWKEMDEQAEKYAPEVITLSDGRRIQRTPFDVGAYVQQAGDQTNYNTYYLKADERGCNACHFDIAETVANMDFTHVELTEGYGMQCDVMECRACHDYGTGYVWKDGEFGTFMHGIHSGDTFPGDCWSCHNATNNGETVELELWDEVKHEVLQGITYLDDESFEADFTYDQDVLSPMFDMNWYLYPYSNVAISNNIADVEEDDETFENWEISVGGLCDNPFSMTLEELIETAPSVERIATNMCVMIPSGGDAIANVAIKGIPFSWLIEQAGMTDEATAIMSIAPDGWQRAIPLDDVLEEDAYLVYEMNGERLTWGAGFPVATWGMSETAPCCIRWTTEIEFVNVELSTENHNYWNGWVFDGEYTNKPNSGIFNFLEGQIINLDEPYTWEGYAYAGDDPVVEVQFSMDHGATWKSFDTSGSDKSKWVYWYFTYTPDAVGSQLLMVRAVDDKGNVTPYPDEIMFNVQAPEGADVEDGGFRQSVVNDDAAETNN